MIFDRNQQKVTSNVILDIKEKALQIVRSRGPLLPVQITKDLGINVMFASALLSELVDNKSLKLSNTKVGGSPMYYVFGQEPKLQALRDKLNDKQQKAFDMLKQQKVLRDVEQEPVIRLALRDIKDFAVPLNVIAGSFKELFWKWYLTSDAEAEPEIKDKLNHLEKKQILPQKDIQQDLSQIEKDLKKLEEKEAPKLIEQKVRETVNDLPEIKPEPKIKQTRQRKPKQIKQPALQTADELPQNQIDETDEFMMKSLSFFKQNSIAYNSVRQIRKDGDFEAVVQIPSAVGSVTYFCKAKNKQKITDSDLSLLFVQSQMRKMPILLVTTGELTKKASELLNNEFRNIAVKKI